MKDRDVALAVQFDLTDATGNDRNDSMVAPESPIMCLYSSTDSYEPLIVVVHLSGKTEGNLGANMRPLRV